MQPRPLIVGLDDSQVAELQATCDVNLIGFATLPRIAVVDGELFVESASRSRLLPVSSVVFHGIFEDDFEFLAGLALWGGPCLPNARALMDCRHRLPCLVRALSASKFAEPARGFASAGILYPDSGERVAKWGNWHCGENKLRVPDDWRAEHHSIVEPFIQGNAVRVVVMGEHAWQIRLDGPTWLKSIHDKKAAMMPIDERLLADTRNVAKSVGLEIAANDYMIDESGNPHLLELNHVPNVTRFPEIWLAYCSLVSDWINTRGNLITP